jgi:hypothetical protein
MNKYTQEKTPDKLISWNIDRKTKFFSRERFLDLFIKISFIEKKIRMKKKT